MGKNNKSKNSNKKNNTAREIERTVTAAPATKPDKPNDGFCFLLETEKGNVQSVKLIAGKENVNIDIIFNDTTEPLKYSITDNAVKKLVKEQITLKAISDKYFVSDIYQFIAAAKQRQNKNIIAFSQRNRAVMPKTDLRIDDIYNYIKPNVVGDNQYDGSSSQSNQINSNSQNTDSSKKALQEIAALLHEKYHIQMNNTEQIDLLLKAIKAGIEQLAEKNSSTAPAQTAPSNNANMQKQLTEASKLASDNKRMYEDAKKRLDELQNDAEKANAKLTETTNALNEKIRQIEAEKQKLEVEIKQLKSGGIDIKGEMIAAVDALSNDIEKGGYMFNFDGTQVDNSFLVQQAGFLRDTFNNCTAQSSNELREKYKDIIRKELKNKSGLFTKLAQYMVYSRLPFMIEPHENCKNFIPTRVMSIYNKVVAIIAPYGFSQVTPMLFVETVGDGEYVDITGQSVSELASMCPLLAQHKEMVDRDNKSKVITDVVKIGFSENGNVIEKAEVICV